MVKKVANTNLLNGVTIFVAVINAGSFTAAARSLGRSTSYISKEITRLEKRLNSRLLNRTTRTISLTDAGRAYFERCQQIVIDAENAERSLNQLQDTPRGLLRVNAPASFGASHLRDCLATFMQQFPEIVLEVEFNDRMIDVVAEAYDVVVRVGGNKDSSLVARKFTHSKLIVVASPDYLQKNGEPSEAAELAGHDCLAYSLIPNPGLWAFSNKGSQSVVSISPRLIADNAGLEVTMAVHGIGITRLPLFCCEQEVADGRLIVILQQYEQPELEVFAVYPHRQYLTAKVRVFVDFLVEWFGE